VTKNVREFLAKHSNPVVLHLPYSLELAPFSFFLLPSLKIILKEKQYFKASQRYDWQHGSCRPCQNMPATHAVRSGRIILSKR
jgi:hypothetical protein